MILQKIIMPDMVCGESTIYYQADIKLNNLENGILIPAEKKASFFSYMNMFDIDTWKKYTTLEKVIFQLTAKGCGTVVIKTKTADNEKIITVFDIDGKDLKTYFKEINLKQIHGCCYFEIQTKSEILIKDACFSSLENAQKTKCIRIALNICTYHRNTEIKRNMELLRSSRFFQPQDELYEKLQIMVVDNGSELKKVYESNIRLVHNPNTGGSGGFKRGLEEIRTWQSDTTHVVFMDDDAEFQIESLYRLYALLSYIKSEYIHESVAGRMFRTDNRKVQYTAAEIWNRGNLIHIGLNADMTRVQNIFSANKNSCAEYGGWWFCCYPMEFIRNNDPLPFFIHCDDVEYGLRHGGTPIILNGIQVWHETYEYRQSPVIAYYDIRNPLIVNAKYCDIDADKFLQEWKQQISFYHVQGNYYMEYIAIRGMFDFLRGKSWFMKNGHTKVTILSSKREKLIQIYNKIFWRYNQFVIKNKYLKIQKNYKSER